MLYIIPWIIFDEASWTERELFKMQSSNGSPASDTGNELRSARRDSYNILSRVSGIVKK